MRGRMRSGDVSIVATERDYCPRLGEFTPTLTLPTGEIES